jgi:hypothetical protein
MTSSEWRLRHAPVRELSDVELETAHVSGFVTPAVYRADLERRRQWRAATDVRVRAAFAEVA